MEVPQGMVLARVKCPDCDNIDEFLIPRSGLTKRAGGFSLAVAFPNLAAPRIAQLSDHKCPACRGST